jgi:serine/threonine protein kinase
MEYVAEAQTLRAVMRSETNPFYGNPLKALGLFQQITEALLACEENTPPIVHRDLSPANVLILPDDSAQLIDFGLCHIEGKERVTLTDEGVGTINYMAPECESGAEGKVGVHSDLYAAGKILWSAITGQMAFSRERPAFTSKSMQTMFPQEPTTWHLHHIFEKTIRHNWQDRWLSAKDALHCAREVRFLIESSYPPLEIIGPKCPICGVGKLGKFEGDYLVFGNPNPDGILSQQCSYCGICFARDVRKQAQNLDARKSLE